MMMTRDGNLEDRTRNDDGPSRAESLALVAVMLTPVIVGLAVLDVVGHGSLGAVRSGPAVPVERPETAPEIHIDIGPDFDDVIDLPFDENGLPKATPAGEEENEGGPCDPVQRIRESFKPRHLRCEPPPVVG